MNVLRGTFLCFKEVSVNVLMIFVCMFWRGTLWRFFRGTFCLSWRKRLQLDLYRYSLQFMCCMYNITKISMTVQPRNCSTPKLFNLKSVQPRNCSTSECSTTKLFNDVEKFAERTIKIKNYLKKLHDLYTLREG